MEAGKTNRVEIEIAAPQKITGIVRQPDGQPAAGLPVRIVGGFGPDAAEVKTDAGGKFELEWNQRPFGQNDTTACILVRDAEHNLAVAQDLDEDTDPSGFETRAGAHAGWPRGIRRQTASPMRPPQLVFWTGRSGAWLDGLAADQHAGTV